MALLHHSRSGRSWAWKLGGRVVENWRSAGVDYGFLRWGDEHDVLDNGESFAVESRRGPGGRQPLQQFAFGAGRRYRKIEMVFPVHQTRRARLRCHANSSAARAGWETLTCSGQPQRIFLRAGPEQWQINYLQRLRESDLEQQQGF